MLKTYGHRIDAGVQATPEDTEEDIILHGIFFAEKTSVHVLETTLDESNSFKSHPALLELPADFTTLSTTYKQYDLFLDIRDLVNSWSSIWGGIENWEQALNVLFKRAITNGSRPARELVRQVYRWCEKGQNILNNLDEIQGRLPSDPMAYHLLWKYHNQQVKLLVKGITILECRMKSINFSLLSPGELDYHSALRNLFQTSDANTSLLN